MLKQIARSLRGRLVISAFVFLMIFLGLTGYILDRAFQNSVEKALLERLKTHIYALLAAAEDDKYQLTMPAALQDPEFNRIDSGRYGIITLQNGTEIWRSLSALSLNISLPQPALPGKYRLSETLANDESLLLFSYAIIWEHEDDSETNYNFWVVLNKAPSLAEISGFRTTLWRWLGGIGLLLLIMQSIILRWGLSPLPRLAKDLQKIEQGEQQQLTGNYPSELEGVATNLNILIANERKQRQRYRNTLADLAHSLKTPLAILRGVTSKAPTPDTLNTMDEQISRMDQIVSYQLQRASSPEVSLAAKPVNLEKLANQLIRSLKKAYADKNISTSISIPPQLQFLGDERDLMEVLGNILDNAFKACQQQISLSATLSNEATATLSSKTIKTKLSIIIEDDGQGIAPEQRKNILQRGVRADTASPGQGIGLAVAVDIINSYKGKLQIESSKLGGARFIIELPGLS